MDHQIETIKTLREMLLETKVCLKRAYSTLIVASEHSPVAQNFVEQNKKAIENLVNEFNDKPGQANILSVHSHETESRE